MQNDVMLPVPVLGKLKIRKSNGVAVTLDVHRLLAAANAARDRCQWEKAAKLYWQALTRNDSLGHIWLQYGHMLLQSKDYDQAEIAYRRARTLDPESDVDLHLGHLHKERGNLPAATRAYMRAARASPVNGDAVLALHTLMAAGFDVSPQEIMSLLTMKQPFPDHTTVSPTASQDEAAALSFKTEDPDGLAIVITGDGGPSGNASAATLELILSDGTAPIVFDASDLISYFRNARLPTGIQRVQIEMIRGALETREEGTVLVCAFLDHRDEWVEISRPLFRHLCGMSLESGDRTATDWISVLTQLRLEMTMANALLFPQQAYLINLGTSWWLQNYFLYVRKAKAESNIRYVPFVHDLIPVMANEHCVTELTQDFISWVIGAYEHADYFLVNSLSTKRDLIAVGARLGHAVDPERVTVIRLDADFRKPVTLPNGAARLAQFGVVRDNFVLFVSTIESRKNHLGAFEAWIRLIKTYGIRRVPYLVCVGNRGWLNEAIYARLQSHEGLRERVIMLSGLSDGELDLLYRNCLFTLYPSNYEGWGLPVTESLCYGKIPLVSDSSSLPEAGGEFAEYFEAGSTHRLTTALETLIFNPAYRLAKEARIAAGFRPRRWADITGQVAKALDQWSAAEPDDTSHSHVPVARTGVYHPMVRNFKTRIWTGLRSAEVYRAGAGWWGCDDWGCWTKPQGGALELAVPPEVTGAVRFYLHLHGLPNAGCRWTVEVDDSDVVLTGDLAAGAFKWVTVDIRSFARDRVVRLSVRGDTIVDLRTVTDGGDPRIVSVGVAGFYYCAENDTAARTAFLEAYVLRSFEAIAFNREPVGDVRPRAIAVP